nr:glycosyltransferase family 2 protein [Mitsuokella multacida]
MEQSRENTEEQRYTISILVPCYNEEGALNLFYERTAAVIDSLQEYDFEILFVNDGSQDNTLSIMHELHQRDARVSYLNLSRNFGKEIAMIAGIDYLRGDAAIIMDADLQDPPELIPKMIYWWQQGYDDVSAKRSSRAGETFFKKWTSHTFYRILQHLTDIPIQPDVGDFRLLDRQCLDAVRLMRESQRYNKGIFSWIGFRKKEVLFARQARISGRSKWNYWKLLNLAIEGITSFSIAPLRMASFMGCLLALLSILYMAYIVIRTLLYGGDVPGYPSLVSIILFIGGIQLLFLGIIGEYLGRIFNESKCRPLYFVKDYNGRCENNRIRKE